MNYGTHERAIKELTRAKKSLLAAKTLLEKDFFEDCVSRAYYAVLHAAGATSHSSEIADSGRRLLSYTLA